MSEETFTLAELKRANKELRTWSDDQYMHELAEQVRKNRAYDAEKNKPVTWNVTVPVVELIMELVRVSPGDDILRMELRRVLAHFGYARWSEGYEHGLAEGESL